jgi:AraC-like DNA-binding protein
MPVDFADSLKQALRSYLGDGYLDINLAAGIAGTSERTLQRVLADSGLTYRRLIQEARFEAAVLMLNNPGIKIIDVAYALGYENPSNFSRAFRRMAGVTPYEFRIQQTV